MTLTCEDVVAHLAPTLKAAGMRKRRYWWYWTGEEVTWAFRILKSPYGGMARIKQNGILGQLLRDSWLAFTEGLL